MLLFVSINCHILLHSYYRSLDATWWRTSNTNSVCSLLLFSILQNWNIQLGVCFTHFYFTHAEGESTTSLYRTTSVLKALHSHTAVWLSWVIRPWVRLNVGWSLLGIKWHEFINQWQWNCGKLFCLNRCNKTNSEWRRCRSWPVFFFFFSFFKINTNSPDVCISNTCLGWLRVCSGFH